MAMQLVRTEDRCQRKAVDVPSEPFRLHDTRYWSEIWSQLREEQACTSIAAAVNRRSGELRYF